MGKKKCFIEGCGVDYSSNKENNISFHTLRVSNPNVYQQWITAIRVKNSQENVCSHPKYAVICSQHFSDDSFEIFIEGFARRLKANSVPSIFPRNQNMENVELITDETEIEIDLAPSSSDPLTTNNSNTNTPKRQKILRRYPGDFNEDASPRSLKECIRLLKLKVKKQNVTIKRLRTTLNRQKLRVCKWKDLFSSLREKKLISENTM